MRHPGFDPLAASYVRSPSQRALAAAAVSIVLLVGISSWTLRLESEDAFSLFLAAVIVWGLWFGPRGGLASAMFFSIYAYGFVELVSQRDVVIGYWATGSVLYLVVGFVVGKLSQLYRTVKTQQQEIALARSELERQLAEKKTLLTEVHHRIKNNMNTVTTMLSLQAEAAETAGTSRVAAALREAERRIHSMGVLYDKLYRRENTGEMSAAQYLPALVKEVAATFGARDRVRVRTEVDDFTLETKVLSHLGVAVNELVANAMKHAFPHGESGELVVSAWVVRESVTVSITDTGPGFSPSFDADGSSGFGFTLVRAVAEQLRGTVHIDRTPDFAGGRIVLTFPVGPPHD